MPVTHELSRTAAALGTALALIFLPFAGTTAPANASPSLSDEANAPVVGTAGTEAGSSAGGTEAASAADSGSAGNDDRDEPASPNPKADDDTGDEDPACDPKTDGDGSSSSGTDDEKPCAVKDSLDTIWNATSKTIRISPSEDLPDSWIDEPFDGPKNTKFRPIAPQGSSESATSSDPTADAAEKNGETDDSGTPVPHATDDDVPTEFMLNKDGYVVDAAHPDEKDGMEFTHFVENPEWTFTSDGNNIIVEGDEYTEEGNGGGTADVSTGQDADKNGSKDDSGTDNADSTDDGDSKDSSNDAGMSASKNSEAGTDGTKSDDDANNSSDSSGDKANSSSSSDSKSSSDGSSDSKSSDSAKADSKESDSSSSSDADSAKKNSDSDSSSSSDDSDSGKSDSVGDADNDGSSNKDGGKDDKGSADKDGSGTTSGGNGPDGADTTPDPETGNGSSDTRDEIPGDVGDDWMPGNGESPPPDYSDPVPQNPDTPVPDDDKDLITGGDTPEPRSDKPPTTSFGESIVSTIVSSWPIFILAASGMAAVGFIIWLVGRRNKQN